MFRFTNASSALLSEVLVLGEKQVLAETNYNIVNEEGAA